ncbi:MAG: hypothetical protein F6K50_34420 [Moorea sp. SIO3I7]|uniref:hypothetical protein n=1 Tax=Moorena sp. SIO3I8 TaxID=2607833 RepID=UPI0013C9BA8B|nr:hypothetical protein [Moorena sp. SIO3I8]NEO00367.1 hypothetical protein [Moorena sp. SIO3I7]
MRSVTGILVEPASWWNRHLAGYNFHRRQDSHPTHSHSARQQCLSLYQDFSSIRDSSIAAHVLQPRPRE